MFCLHFLTRFVLQFALFKQQIFLTFTFLQASRFYFPICMNTELDIYEYKKCISNSLRQRVPNTFHVHTYLKLLAAEKNKLQIINYKH